MWVEVGNLAIGEKVRNKSNKTVTLLRKEQQTKTQNVYNLEIYRNHNYLVGEQEVLVHNWCFTGNPFEVIATLKRDGMRNIGILEGNSREGLKDTHQMNF